MKILARLLFIASFALVGVWIAGPTKAVTLSADVTAPGSPIDSSAFPETKTASDSFIIFWDNPTDPSGIDAAWYKLDSAPTSASDGTKVTGVVDPSTPTIGLIEGLKTGARTTRTLYLWLEDGSGNKDHTTAITLTLRPEGADDTFIRVAGSDRYRTAVKVSEKVFPVDDTAGAVVIANGASNADALAGVPLAFQENAPILMVTKNVIHPETFAELKRVLPAGGKVYLLGGGAVIDNVHRTFLESQGFVVERLSGGNRMETSISIIEKLDALKGTAPTRINLVNGYAPADALSIAPLAAFLGEGIALTERDLSQTTRNYINKNLGTLTDVTVVGGSAVISDGVVNLLRGSGYSVDRIWGANRFATSRQIALKFVQGSPPAPPGVGLVNGYTLVDAFSAGVHAAAQLYPLLLVQKDLAGNTCLPTADFMQDFNAQIEGGYAYGGTAVISNASVSAAERMISGTLDLNCT